MKQKHVMVDCETLGLRVDSALLTIGAVMFDPNSTFLGRRFHAAIDPSDAQRRGLTIDASTVVWWLRQAPAAQQALTSMLQTSMLLETALTAFESWLRETAPIEGIKLWTCGHMDVCWLTSAYSAIGRPIPFHYRVGDFRTIRDEFAIPEDSPPATVSHDALEDAVYQAQMLQNIYRRLGKHE